MKITIEVSFYNANQAKEQYRLHFGYAKSHKVTKSDLANWFGNLVSADLDAITGDESETEPEY